MIRLHQRIIDGEVVKEVRYYSAKDEALPEVSERAPILVLLEVPNNLSDFKTLQVVEVIRLTKEQSDFILRSYCDIKSTEELVRTRLTRT